MYLFFPHKHRFLNNLCCSTFGSLGHDADSLHTTRSLLSILGTENFNINMEEAITAHDRPLVGLIPSRADNSAAVFKWSITLWYNISTCSLYFTEKGYHDIHMVDPPQHSTLHCHNNAHFHFLQGYQGMKTFTHKYIPM